MGRKNKARQRRRAAQPEHKKLQNVAINEPETTFEKKETKGTNSRLGEAELEPTQVKDRLATMIEMREGEHREREELAELHATKMAMISAHETPKRTKTGDAICRVACGCHEEYKEAVSRIGKFFGTLSLNGCNHDTPSGHEREDTIQKLVVYATQRIVASKIQDMDLTLFHMVILNDYGDCLSEKIEDLVALALADAANLIVKKDFEKAKYMAKIHMLFSAWINAGKPTGDILEFEKLGSVGKTYDSDWLDEMHVASYKIESPEDVFRYVHKHLSCDCIKSKKKAAKEETKAHGVNCHYCEEPGAKLMCARCNAVTYVSHVVCSNFLQGE